MVKNSDAYDRWVTAFMGIYPHVSLDDLPNDFSKEECFMIGLLAAKSMILNRGFQALTEKINEFKEELNDESK